MPCHAVVYMLYFKISFKWLILPNTISVIPRCVLHHWDFVPHRVCRSSAAFLDDISRLPLLDVSLLSPGLLSAQSSLRNVRSLRHQLSYLRDLVYKAKFERGMKLFKTELGGRIHLVLDTEIFSMKDLEQVNIGQMKVFLQAYIRTCSMSYVHDIFSEFSPSPFFNMSSHSLYWIRCWTHCLRWRAVAPYAASGSLTLRRLHISPVEAQAQVAIWDWKSGFCTGHYWGYLAEEELRIDEQLNIKQ